jgi:hypothetical protein
MAMSPSSRGTLSEARTWLLLETAGTEVGPTQGSLLAQTIFIQRLNTAGGLVPTSGCGKRSDIGGMTLSPYVAEYYFYRPSGE